MNQKLRAGHVIRIISITDELKCVSYLTEDAAYVLPTGGITRVVKVVHDFVEPDCYLLIFFYITTSKFGILFTESQWLLRLKWRFVVQTLRVTAPPPGLEEQQQYEEKEVRDEGMVQITGLQGHGVEETTLFELR